MDEEFMVLGDTEKYLVARGQEVITNCLEKLNELVEDLAKIDGIDWEQVVLDPDRKKMAITLIPYLEKLSRNLDHNRLLTLIASSVIPEQG